MRIFLSNKGHVRDSPGRGRESLLTNSQFCGELFPAPLAPAQNNDAWSRKRQLALPGSDAEYPPCPLPATCYFFDNLRKGNNALDAGAVEYEPVATAVLTVTSTRLAFTGVVRGTTQTSTLTGTAH